MFLTAGYIHFIAFRLLPLRTFPQPFSHSISAVQTFSSAVRPHPFKTFQQPFIRSTSSVQKFFAAIHPFVLIRSRIFRSRSSVRPHPFKNFPQPFSHSTSSVHKLSSAVQCNRFEWFLDPFLIRSLAVRSTVRTDTVRNVFA